MNITKSLELPDGYQRTDWYKPGVRSAHGVTLNDPNSLLKALHGNSILHLYTQHEIFYQNELKHTRSSPNWDGGMVTYATCKHLMRTTYQRHWDGCWIAGLCPSHCCDNTLLFCGVVWRQFPGNYTLRGLLKNSYPDVYKHKLAYNNPRGDLYTPRRVLRSVAETQDHHNFVEPPNHTRSTEYYKKSPGSVSEREDGKIPKWWRDLEYTYAGKRPPVFILQPCWVFSQPMLWTAREPRRAVLKMTASEFSESLSKK